MKRAFIIGLGIFGLLAGQAPAAAADLPPRYGPPLVAAAPVYYSVYNWTGFYAGINGGGGAARNGTASTASMSRAGSSAGPSDTTGRSTGS